MTEHPRLIVAGADGTERSFTIARRCSAPYLAELIGEVAPSESHSNRASGIPKPLQVLERRPLKDKRK
jgi:hypothetical protein